MMNIVLFIESPDLLSKWVIFTPHWNEFTEMVRAKNWTITGQVVEAVHDDGNNNIEHDKGAEKYERHKVEVGHVWTTGLVWLHLIKKSDIIAHL